MTRRLAVPKVRWATWFSTTYWNIIRTKCCIVWTTRTSTARQPSITWCQTRLSPKKLNLCCLIFQVTILSTFWHFWHFWHATLTYSYTGVVYSSSLITHQSSLLHNIIENNTLSADVLAQIAQSDSVAPRPRHGVEDARNGGFLCSHSNRY